MATEMFALDNKTLYALAGTGLNLCFQSWGFGGADLIELLWE